MAKVTPAIPAIGLPCASAALPEKFTRRGTTAGDGEGLDCWALEGGQNNKLPRHALSKHRVNVMACSCFQIAVTWRKANPPPTLFRRDAHDVTASKTALSTTDKFVEQVARDLLNRRIATAHQVRVEERVPTLYAERGAIVGAISCREPRQVIIVTPAPLIRG